VKRTFKGGHALLNAITNEIEKISADTLRVVNLTESVRFYRDVFGMELVSGCQCAAVPNNDKTKRDNDLGNVLRFLRGTRSVPLVLAQQA
jgi:hypothetical protein